MYVRCMYVQYAAVCYYRRFVCVSGAPVWVRSGHRNLYIKRIIPIYIESFQINYLHTAYKLLPYISVKVYVSAGILIL
jgi:hypothetical protein